MALRVSTRSGCPSTSTRGSPSREMISVPVAVPLARAAVRSAAIGEAYVRIRPPSTAP